MIKHTLLEIMKKITFYILNSEVLNQNVQNLFPKVYYFINNINFRNTEISIFRKKEVQ
jgi:hypothetical protein